MFPDKNPEATARARRDKKEDRQFQFRLALTSGLIGLVGALAGTFSAFHITDRQITAQNEQAQAQFLRAERRKAYGDVVAADRRLFEAESAIDDLAFNTNSDVRQLKPSRGTVKTVRTLTNRLQNAQAVLVMIGSTSALKAGDDLVMERQRYGSELIGAAGYPRSQ